MDNRTFRGMLSVIACLGLMMIGGCRVCDSCDDCAYPTYGGSWERTNRNHGRVGSIFAPAGAKVASTGTASLPASETWNPNATVEAEDQDDDEDDTKSLLDDLEEDLPEPRMDAATDET